MLWIGPCGVCGCVGGCVPGGGLGPSPGCICPAPEMFSPDGQGKPHRDPRRGISGYLQTSIEHIGFTAVGMRGDEDELSSRGHEENMKTQRAERDVFTTMPPCRAHCIEKCSRVPHVPFPQNCHVCVGSGRRPCKDCAGAGNKVCWVCNGAGNRQASGQCSHCNGQGRENCSGCHGNGSRECETCRGKRQLLAFITLKVQWTNYKDDFVVEQASGLKAENLSGVSGREMFKDSQYMLYPLMGFPDAAISQASQRLVQEHQAKYFKTSRILQQRHTIELIPVSRVGYRWKGKCYTYYVFGNESKVYTDDYPATCCCSVM